MRFFLPIDIFVMKIYFIKVKTKQVYYQIFMNKIQDFSDAIVIFLFQLKIHII